MHCRVLCARKVLPSLPWHPFLFLKRALSRLVKYLECASFCWAERCLTTDFWVLALKSAHFGRQALNESLEVSGSARCLDYEVMMFI